MCNKKTFMFVTHLFLAVCVLSGLLTSVGAASVVGRVFRAAGYSAAIWGCPLHFSLIYDIVFDKRRKKPGWGNK